MDPITLQVASLEISSGPLFPISDKKQEIEDLGLAEILGYLLFDTTQFLISLGRGHVAMVTVVWSISMIDCIFNLNSKDGSWMPHRDQHTLIESGIGVEFQNSPSLKRHSTKSLANVRLVALSISW